MDREAAGSNPNSGINHLPPVLINLVAVVGSVPRLFGLGEGGGREGACAFGRNLGYCVFECAK